MTEIKVIGKLAFVKGIKEATHVSLKEAKDIADEIIPTPTQWSKKSHCWEGIIATFDPRKYGWNEQTLKEIASLANMYSTSIIIINYE